MKEQYVGYEYVFYESKDEPRTLILEKRDKYVKCSEKKAFKIQEELHKQNNFALFMLNLLMQEQYKGWKIKEI